MIYCRGCFGTPGTDSRSSDDPHSILYLVVEVHHRQHPGLAVMTVPRTPPAIVEAAANSAGALAAFAAQELERWDFTVRTSEADPRAIIVEAGDKMFRVGVLQIAGPGCTPRPQLDR